MKSSDHAADLHSSVLSLASIMMIAFCCAPVHNMNGCIQVFLRLVGEELIMNAVDRILDAAALDEAGNADLRCADDLNVNVRA